MTAIDALFPAQILREDEERLVRLVASGSLDPADWRAAGPAFFMAGLAVALASAREFDRPRLLALAETLHPGVSQVDVFATWLARSPWRPSRFMPLVRAELGRAA